MTDKEKIRKEVERLFTKNRERSSREGYAAAEQLRKVLSFIDSLEEEPVSEDTRVKKSQEILHDSETSKENGDSLTCSGSEELEKAAVEAYKKIVEKGGVSFLKIFKAGALWKENQLMKDAIVGTKVFSGIGSNSKTGECVPYTEYKICISDKLCDGLDKVKLIIIKEE